MAHESLVALRDRREQVIARLSEAYAGDVVDIDELDHRLDLAHGASTVAELDQLVADLAPATAAAATALVPATSVAIDDPTRPTEKRLRVVMGSVERRGRWVVAREQTVRVLWGSAELDFRDASFGPGVTTLHVRVTMGSLELILPPQLAVDVDVSSFAGSVEERHRAPAEPDPTRPLLRVVGEVWFGSLELETRLPGESRGDARRRERYERRSRRRALAGGRRALPPGRNDM
jgi:hypothetical protein